MRWKRKRFRGAGGSAEREFNRQLRKNVRESWRVCFAIGAVIGVFALWSAYLAGVAARFTAGTAGSLFGVLFVMFSLGGHISAFRWWLGAEGERKTAKQVEKLPEGWHCEHDLEHVRGNYDHVLVGPAGVFLLDSKFLHGTVAVGEDMCRCGRLTFRGAAFRGGAYAVKRTLDRRLGDRSPWVQAVVVIWGDFPQQLVEQRDVVYVHGAAVVSTPAIPRRAASAVRSRRQ